jgi:2-polyprenyl-3-methyl-5-hydroxy-6-metoxy-1,4-benzoquinol methylase
MSSYTGCLETVRPECFHWRLYEGLQGMNDIFYRKREENFFDNLVVDIKKLYEEHPIDRKADARPNLVPFVRSPFHKMYRNPLIPLRYREYFWRVARQINLDLTWFQEFKSYWSSVLGGRPLWGVQDFFFLRGLYRVKSQDNQVPDTNDPHIHLQAWQRPELLYQLLHLVFKESLVNQLGILHQLYQLKRDARCLLEFGCGTAPITASLFEFYRPREDLKVYFCDIQTLAFHYATYRFRRCSNVEPILLVPEDEFLLNLNEPVDAIFCMEVFEHLNKPFETVKIFHQILNPGGLLFFSYIKSKGEGLDTLHGVRERNDVLDYVSQHFEMLRGTISEDKSMGLTIAKKRHVRCPG